MDSYVKFRQEQKEKLEAEVFNLREQEKKD